MTRFFRYSFDTYQSLLRQNPRHQLAMRHALRLYSANAIYSYIPKNACSTMRLSLALANGCIKDKKDFNWIHHNNDTFSADLASAQTAAYTFVILRCPYSRLASVYLDKVVERYPDAWQLHTLSNQRCTIGEMSFDFFVRQLKTYIRDSNIHWRPQVDFLLYEQYDDYFSLEEFDQAEKTLKDKIQLSIVDARNLTKHGQDRFTLIGEKGEYAAHSAFSIMQMKYTKGESPSPLALYTDELVAIVKERYREDIELYQSLFGSKNLLFT